MTPDNELLRQYATTRSEGAFAELVRRHVNLVYSAALRQVQGDAHLAQDVAQTVFTDLARKAALLSRRESLSGWLYTSAHFAAAKIARTESRRRDREEKFMREPSHSTSPEAEWEKLRPTLDSAMHELKETDREAVLLRYFENRAFAEVGAKLCLSENAARMRVERAVETLRGLLAKRGITTGAALASVISANAVQTAPGSLATTLARASIASAGSRALLFSKFMTTTNLKLGVGALATAAVVVALIGQQQSQKALRAQNQSMAAQIAQLKSDNADLSNRIAASGQVPSLADDQRAELLRLRGEVTQLRAMKNAPAVATTPATNSLPVEKKTTINLKVRFASVPTADAQAFGAAWAPEGDSSLLSDQQLGLATEALREGTRAHLISEAELTIFSGHEGGAQVTSAFPIDGTNANLGVNLDVVPFYSSDSSIFTLNLAAKLIELTGDPSQPGILTTQMSNQVTLFPGQTVALKTQMPQDGWLPRTGDTEMVPTAPDSPTELLVFVTPKLMDGSSQSPSPSQSEARRARTVAMLNEAHQAMVALLMFANDNEKRFPAALEQAARYLDDGTMNDVETDFDLVSPGSITNVSQPSTTIVLKEKQAEAMPDGRWGKNYGFADGHCEFHSEPNGDFTEFENQHTISVTANQ